MNQMSAISKHESAPTIPNMNSCSSIIEPLNQSSGLMTSHESSATGSNTTLSASPIRFQMASGPNLNEIRGLLETSAAFEASKRASRAASHFAKSTTARRQAASFLNNTHQHSQLRNFNTSQSTLATEQYKTKHSSVAPRFRVEDPETTDRVSIRRFIKDR